MPPTEDCSAQRYSFGVLHHDIELTLVEPPGQSTGAGRVVGELTEAARVIVLDTRGLSVSEVSRLQGTRGKDVDAEILKPSYVPLRFTQQATRLCVWLDTGLAPGSAVALRMSWSLAKGRPGPHASSEEIWAGYDASSFLPTRMDPAQRATLDLRIEAPLSWKVAASGVPDGLRSAAPGDRRAHQFRLRRPSPPFLYAFAAGRFDEAEKTASGVRLRALGPPSSDLDRALSTTAPMFAFLAGRTGAFYPGREYTQVFVRGEAAQEAAGMALLSSSAIEELKKDPQEDWIFSHELAHQWFAWLVPCADFKDFWLNEGFATFFVAAYKESRWGRAAYDREVSLWRKRSAKVHAEGKDAPLSLSSPEAPPRPAPSEAELQPRGITYARGALALHRLREELGDETFWAGIRRYVSERTDKGARSEDLRAALESASGRGLRPFFARWIYAPAPDL